MAFATFGCKVNQYETACMAHQFSSLDWRIVPFTDEADVYVVNTCTVTSHADAKSRAAIRRGLRQKEQRPDVRVVATGCLAQRFPEQIARLGHLELICGNREKTRLFSLLESGHRLVCADISEASVFDEISADKLPGRSRGFLKVQDGCDFACAYCAVPLARGPARSRPLAAVLDQVERLAASGYREVVLGGINLGTWGREWSDGQSLPGLVHQLAAVDGIKRVRLSSLEPQFLTPGFIDELFDCEALAHHLHIPLQSGSDALLSSMGRRYDTALFRRNIEAVRQRQAHTALGFDVIVGLPGETDARFEETLAFLRALAPAYLHVFAYSRRPGTRAATMSDQVHGSVVRERSRTLAALSAELSAAYRQRLLHHRIPLWAVAESEKQGWSTGLSDHWVRVYAGHGDAELAGIPVSERLGGLELVSRRRHDSDVISKTPISEAT
ncbi:MAG: tRNA (N(6)-L-threonylcarbamoyladenosine(37)-C(2))-methylthiotransferase MtaB [Candidatus Cloacimonetes bacterium]|nr:tRNA (N(6)-L-threonylcarbamoyladenosine(37)-C(2))-methylthiotransferase MtaB [Candidatus Cloacimonadota bacterium]